MHKTLLLSIVSLFIFFSFSKTAFAQETLTDSAATAQQDWDFGGTGTINFSQVSLTNWAAGGQSSVSVLGITNLFGNYKKGKNTWNNTLDVTYGTVKLENQRVRKSDDKLELNLKYGRAASTDWFYTVQLNFRSQLTPTYTNSRDTLLSNFLSPAFVLASLGMDYKPNDKLSIFISPITGKFTIVKDQELADQGAFGVERAATDVLGNPIVGTGENFRKEFGGFVNVRYKNEILQNVIFQSKIDLFSNYLHNPTNLDINWENLLDFKVNSFLSASLFVHMVYDDDILINIDDNDDGVTDARGPRVQLKQSLGIGLTYKFD
ncbi:DUF3078 domain-containing protein [Pontibacter sp. BT310]|uniref:DUF3078 domain-containing protein n=1 Tax=Pontibacter populi TaxID=890055 RepID=A0ABS6XFJ5_9BACT|nr:MULTISPECIES: DUF3078 domain-containing protein [Pontibacter]MBJ6119561.1 DUF3078 domain-containing protein [Pontibacter sp. BT310]MBR0571988.1 DUF3078 domain-containing protein [Microvirga sp. STS03]MBW3366414.1 DUF3078 domain-containing protein [Pontibacter populi]